MLAAFLGGMLMVQFERTGVMDEPRAQVEEFIEKASSKKDIFIINHVLSEGKRYSINRMDAEMKELRDDVNRAEKERYEAEMKVFRVQQMLADVIASQEYYKAEKEKQILEAKALAAQKAEEERRFQEAAPSVRERLEGLWARVKNVF